MQKKALIITIAASICLLSTITIINRRSVSSLREQRDSLATAVSNNNQRIESITAVIDTINNALDSIAAEENILFMPNGREGYGSRREVLNKIDKLAEIISNQKDRIENLEQQLANNTTDSSLFLLIHHMKNQIIEKDNEIAQLKRDLSNKNFEILKQRKKIAEHETRIAENSQAIDSLSRTSQEQSDELARQDELLNSGYVFIGTKKVLKDKGILKKRDVLSSNDIDQSLFTKIDIRLNQEIMVSGKKPKILSNMPSSSYNWEQSNENTYTLKITDPTSFWSITKYLVIQTN